jgi:hypothetical protein
MNARLQRDVWLCVCVIAAFAAVLSMLYPASVLLDDPARFIGNLIGPNRLTASALESMTPARLAVAIPAGFTFLAWWSHRRYQRALRLAEQPEKTRLPSGRSVRE